MLRKISPISALKGVITPRGTIIIHEAKCVSRTWTIRNALLESFTLKAPAAPHRREINLAALDVLGALGYDVIQCC